jgi:hypothetical protein
MGIRILLTNFKCGNKLKHENEAEGPRGAMDLQPCFLIGQNPKFFYTCVGDEGCSASLTIAVKNKLEIYSISCRCNGSVDKLILHQFLSSS